MSSSIYTRNRRSWRMYNRHRIDRAVQMEPDKGRLAFYVIPYLLDANQAGLPGYVDGESAPGGIYLYTPGEEEEQALRRVFPEFDFRQAEGRRSVRKLTIESLLLMGSIGTVAQTKKSDYDYWVVINEPFVSAEEMTALRKKLAAIEKWGAEQKMEIHFFLSDIKKTRENDFGATDKESSGSSQARILKEEFYRTVILAAGKDPMWWVFPPGLDDNAYDEHKRDMYLEAELDESEVVDLGNAGAIPVEEYFGALLWQFNKAMDSPSKSVLKMALMESFISAGTQAGLLCDILKGAVHSNPELSDQADPYLLMFDYIRRFYVKNRKKSETRILEKCFFLKSFDSSIKSVDDGEGLPYKERTMRLLLRRWKWDDSLLAEMNGFSGWEHTKVSNLASSLHNFMINIYKELADLVAAQPNVKQMITDADLTVLGRKLFTLYSKKPGKVEYLKRVMDELEALDGLSFAAEIKRGARPVWAVYRDNITSQVAKGLPVESLLLKKGGDPVELMLWLALNRVYSKNTFLYLIPNQTPVALKDLQQLMEKISGMFPCVDLASLRQDDLLNKAVVERVLVVVNLLSPRWQKEIDSLHVLFLNSWGELYCHALDAKAGFPRLLDTLLQTRPGFSISGQSVFDAFIPNGDGQIRLRAEMDEFLVKKFLPRKGGARLS